MNMSMLLIQVNIMRPILFLVLLLCAFHTQAENDNSQVIRGNWFYHWGALPRDSATDQWLFQQSDWIKTDFPENLPDRNGNNIAWIKIDLPSGRWRDPYLFINSVDLSVEVFQKGKKYMALARLTLRETPILKAGPGMHSSSRMIMTNTPYISALHPTTLG